MSASRRAGAFAILVAVALSGCGDLLRRPVPELHSYQLAPTTVTTDIPPSAKVQLRNVSGTDPYQDSGIAYQTSAYKLDIYHFHRWVAPPISMVSDRLREMLNRPSSLGAEQATATQYMLDARVKAFQEVDYDGQHSGVVAIEFCLYPSDPGARALWCNTISKDNPTGGHGIEGAAAAVSLSFNQVMAEFGSELSQETARLSSAARDHTPPQQ